MYVGVEGPDTAWQLNFWCFAMKSFLLLACCIAFGSCNMCLRFPAPMCDSLQYLCAWLWQLESRRKAALKCRWGKCAFSAFHRGRDLSWPVHHQYRAEYLGQGHGQVRMAGFLLFWRTALFLKEQRWGCRTFEGCTLEFPQNKGLPGSKGRQCSVFVFSDFFFQFPGPNWSWRSS